MTRKLVHRIGLGVAVILFAAGAYGWWYMAFGRWPFAGDIRHDFGEVELSGRTTRVEHVFELRNRGSDAITIKRVIASCGCVTAEPPADPIAPGETLSFPVSLNLSAAGHKGAKITLMLEDERIQQLYVDAVGLRSTAFKPGAQQVRIRPGETTTLILNASMQDHDDEPGAVDIDSPTNMTVTFRGWEQSSPRDVALRRAAKWRGVFDVTLLDDQEPDSKIAIAVEGELPVIYDVIVLPPLVSGDE